MKNPQKLALITGAGRGIGKAIAKTLATDGFHVVLLSRTETELKQVCSEIEAQGGRASYQVFDLLQKANYPNLLEKIRQQTGTPDVLVHNAAPSHRPVKLTRMSQEEWENTLMVDLEAYALLAKALLEPMIESGWGRLIAIGSVSGVVGAGSYPAYCAAKAGLDGLTKNLAIDYSRYGITVNLISPGFIETERFQKAAPAELLEKFRQATASKRLGKPEDIAHAVSFLASDKASYITGTNLMVCGGLNLGNLW
ncbi:3-oxoacyl-ACP reductase [bacterium (Candidatus Blackallbacteria) CG17_big_fil_post_rev_8_21_14_2_50_48_46]|uniref:3-oxoacyl-ACP reductase n=1 Tax=bacterium (Candidatus Blackallbacteria) CG17_big_fil_post_rev_8_21_14_2_50_48_46 TaxID=2014261 RepID=A0A2M7FZY1_9BACT|nr:MAG: 3-oxoacyl-ACP reductase [bacterium (Candidatus Blackallbacteria) CG18_big_fil_WC_8_21_14_2_50_49_26]PIW15000.1 MAG: 3-oxoacyl-ACP reductase [bacterium (Candidatus Blackallbacteria) CG17_big_fil_post_rev_8_21_14_2_50_48_46]PIW50081.1 MAG: 3-oxoacyl-ACP reductase [bacterium (Candidatus Blackallbacteria) CG13_big_fil_rev_8_21_14_2_50_49_14]